MGQELENQLPLVEKMSREDLADLLNDSLLQCSSQLHEFIVNNMIREEYRDDLVRLSYQFGEEAIIKALLNCREEKDRAIGLDEDNQILWMVTYEGNTYSIHLDRR